MKPLSEHSQDEIKAAVADRYGRVATCPAEKFNFPVGRRFAESVGYDAALLDRLPRGLWESFTGAGNPQAFVDAQTGETVLDMGCGAGLDLCLYAENSTCACMPKRSGRREPCTVSICQRLSENDSSVFLGFQAARAR